MLTVRRPALLFAVTAMAIALSGCIVTSVASTTVKAGTAVAGTAVDVTTHAVGAGSNAVFGDDEDDTGDKNER